MDSLASSIHSQLHMGDFNLFIHMGLIFLKSFYVL